MGLFSSGPDEETKELIDAAKGDSVTADKLTKAETGMAAWDRLNDKPLIDYLDDEEQPHFIIAQQNKRGIHVTEDGDTHTTSIEPDGKFRIMMTVTDSRVLFTAGGSSGDKTVSVDFEDITGAKLRTNSKENGPNRLKITVDTHNRIYTFARIMTNASVNLAGIASDEDEVQNAVEYISTEANINAEHTEKEDSSIRSARRRISDEENGDYVTPERVDKIRDILDDDEEVHYITRGSTVDVEGSSAGSSLFGDDRSRKSGTSGYVRAVITGERVAVKIPQLTGNDERSIPYESITSVDLDTGLVNKRLSLQTPGQTYHIEAHEPGKNGVRQAVKFIRNKIKESNEETIVVEDSSEPDPTEQLKNLKELHDEGVLSDEEFEGKKSDLLDKI